MHRYIIIAILFTTQLVAAQDKKVTLPTSKAGDYQVLFLGEAGLVYSSEKDKKSVLTFYNSNLEALWTKEADQEYSKRDYPNFMVGTRSGSYVYNVEIRVDDFTDKPSYVTQIDKTGRVKKYTIEDDDELGYNLQSVFCDEKYFYYLSSENGNEIHKKKKSSEKLILNRFDAESFARKSFTLDLPLVLDGESTTFWTFLGQIKSEKILASKFVNVDLNKVTISFVAIDDNGRVTRTWKVEPTFDKVFLRPAMAVYPKRSLNHQITDFNYYLTSDSKGNVHENIPKSGFSSVSLDEISEAIYVYGLTSHEPYKRIRPIYEGFYVKKFDLNGKMLWNIEQDAPAELHDYKYFHLNSNEEGRDLAIKYAPDGTVDFSIHTAYLIYEFAIDQQGKIIRMIPQKEFKARTNSVLFGLTPYPTEAFINKFDLDKKTSPSFSRNYVQAHGEFLIQTDSDDSRQLLYFSR